MAAAALSRRSNEIADYPDPDLAIDIDLPRTQVDRMGIYAALKVPEVWRIDFDDVIIERLNAEGIYVVVEASGVLPVRRAEAVRWVLQDDSIEMLTRKRRLRAWMRAEIADRRAPGGWPGEFTLATSEGSIN